jgi:hypothetical protein
VGSAAQRDSIGSSILDKKRTKLVNAALPLISDEGVTKLRRFLHGARTTRAQRRENLVRDVDRVVPRPGSAVRHASEAIIPQDDGLAYFSALNTNLDNLEEDGTRTSINKRMKLAAVAEYLKFLVLEGAGRKNRAGIADLYLFRAIYPNHVTIARPDEEPNISAAHRDWNRLRDWLKQRRLWIEVRDKQSSILGFVSLMQRGERWTSMRDEP